MRSAQTKNIYDKISPVIIIIIGEGGGPFSRLAILREWRVILILWKPDSAGPWGAFLAKAIVCVDPEGKDEDG